MIALLRILKYFYCRFLVVVDVAVEVAVELFLDSTATGSRTVFRFYCRFLMAVEVAVEMAVEF